MAGRTLSSLPNATTVESGDKFLIQQGAGSKQIDEDVLAALYKDHATSYNKNPADGSAHNADDVKDTTNGGSVQDFIDAQYATVTDVATGKFQVGTYVRLTDREMGLFFVQSGSSANGYDTINAGNGNTAVLQLSEVGTAYASQLGLATAVDYTTYFNGGLSVYIDLNNITKIVLDTGDITVSSSLNDSYGSVTFSGNGNLLTPNFNNTLQRIQSQKTDSKKYHGQYNIGGVFNSIAKNAIFKRKEIRVVLFGDSISVAADYDSFGAIPAGYRQPIGVDNYERNNCFGASLFNEICNAVPSDVRVRFYTRSIGGLAYGNIDQPWDSIEGLFAGREQATAGKAWRDCVLDLNPDLVIHGFGMNESATTYIDNFLTKWHQYLESEQKTLSFDQAIVTTPNPNFIDAAPFGDFKGYGLNASKFFVATMQRYIAKKYRYSLIDVAFNSYLKRYGIDTRSVNFKAKPDPYLFPNGASSRVISAGEAPSLSEITPKDLPLYWSTTFTINSSVASNTAGFDFKFTAGSIIVQIGGGGVNIFSGNYGGAGLFIKSITYTMPAATNTAFTVTVTPSSIYLYINDELKIAVSDAPFNSTLPMQFDNSGNNVAVTVVSGLTYGVQFARYGQDAITNGDYYGVLDFTQNPNGGGVNHPSSTMLAEIYLPPAREYITELLKSSIEYDTVIGGTSAGQMVFLGRALGKQSNKITMKDYGSTRETIVKVTSANTWDVIKNTGGAVSIYIDPFDLSVFLFNPSDPVLQIEFTGDWLVKRPTKLGITTPRGSLLPII